MSGRTASGAAIAKRLPGPVALCACCLAALLAACTAHRTPPLPTEIDDVGFRDDLRILAADDFEGRRPGTAGEQKTVAFLTAQFKKLGLKPGNGDSYLQPVPLVEITAGADAMLSVAGRGGVRRLRQGEDMVIWSGRALETVALTRSALVFAGYGIVAPEYGWNDYASVDVRGKTVLLLAGDPGYGSKDPAVFKGNAMSYYGRFAYKAAEAARHGAAGVLMIYDPGPLGYGWSAVENSRLGPVLRSPAADGPPDRPALEGWITEEAARALFGAAGLDGEALRHAAARAGFKPVAMGLAVDATLHNTIRRFDSDNVIGVVVGAERKREYVVYSAHWDGLGRDASGAVLDGAEDNASGVAGLLMLAQSFSRMRPPPGRSIAFIAFTGEESGLLGSRYYVEHPVLPLDQITGVINLDRLHIGGRTRDVVIYGAGNSELEDLVRGLALLQGRDVRPDSRPELGRYYDSDQLSFALHGVPALYAKGGIDDAAGGPQWGRAQIEDYLMHRYRQRTDKYSDSWDVAGAVEDLELYRAVGMRLASTRRFPRWYPNSEFSANRSHPLPGD